jgi:transposase
MNKMVRKQLFVTTEQNRKLKERAAATGLSEGELIRAGIDLKLAQEPEEQRPWREIVDETVAKLSGAWAERENLDEDMREIRRRWNRRSLFLGKKSPFLGKKSKRPS